MIYKYLFSTFIIILIICASILYVAKLETDNITYEVINKDNDVEIRQYEKMILALSTQNGNYNHAFEQGFKELTSYMFGANADSIKIKMIMPVLEIFDRGNEIERQKKCLKENKWHIGFIMQAQYKLCTLPSPTNNSINFESYPARKFIVKRFIGSITPERIKKNINILDEYAKNNQLIIVDTLPILARFNPPWTLPFLKRSEIMIQIDDGE